MNGYQYAVRAIVGATLGLIGGVVGFRVDDWQFWLILLGGIVVCQATAAVDLWSER